METTVIRKGHSWKCQDLCSHWHLWNASSLFPLYLCTADHWGEDLSLPRPCLWHYPNLSALQPTPHQNCQKSFPSPSGAPPCSPRMILSFKVLLNQDLFYTLKSILWFDSVKWFSTNMYCMREKESIFPYNKRRGNKPFLSLCLCQNIVLDVLLY